MNTVVNIMPSIISAIPKVQDDNTIATIKMLVSTDSSSLLFVAATFILYINIQTIMTSYIAYSNGLTCND